MRILFLTKPYVIDPLGIGYLAAVLQKAGHHVGLEHNVDVVDTVRRDNPDIVAFSVTTGQHTEYLDNAREIKRAFPHVTVVFGGPHPTYFPKTYPCVDYIVRGEAEDSFLWLVDRLSRGRHVPDVVEPHPLIQDIDSIPPPDRALLYKFPANRDNPIKNVMTSRGCPFACVYCYNAVYKGLYAGQHVLRHHSVERVIGECVELRDRHNAKFIFFADDEFTINKTRLEKITEMYASRVGLPYHAQLRIDLLTEDKARLLSQSGCKSVTFAIESGNETYRNSVLKRLVSNSQILNGADILHRYGIAFRTENMIGLPGETLDDAIATLDLNIACRPDMAWASLYQPYPGTVLGNKCVADGMFNGMVDDLKPSFFEDSVLPLPNKNAFINLQRLFGVTANYPVLRKHLRTLLSVSPNKVYSRVYQWWKTNRYDKKLYVWEGKR